jgi:hypothetical protein
MGMKLFFIFREYLWEANVLVERDVTEEYGLFL